MKKRTKIFFLSFIALIILIVSCFLWLLSKPSVRFMLVMNDVLSPSTIEEKELNIHVESEEIPMLMYARTGGEKKGYFFLIHGLTPKSYKHPTIKKISQAICWASGYTVLVPHIRGSETSRDIKYVCKDIANIYTELRAKYPGRYNAFGACVSATILLLALNDVALEIYPEKIFLHGPFLNGKMLADFYNKSGIEVDYIVKLANAIRHKSFTDSEKELISKAIIATKPGITDREEMKRILGEKLYFRVEETPVDYSEFKEINELTLFPKDRPLPKCKYYITHSRSDNIIPYTMGMGLYQYLLQRGLPSRFVATGAFQHSDKANSLCALISEINALMDFFDDLFDESEKL
ncbi:MAG: hypothetical protein N2316_05560 [Spirochaetes bacterium]|nr:hypothetical protein [Spirochaetota bacterium]